MYAAACKRNRPPGTRTIVQAGVAMLQFKGGEVVTEHSVYQHECFKQFSFYTKAALCHGIDALRRGPIEQWGSGRAAPREI